MIGMVCTHGDGLSLCQDCVRQMAALQGQVSGAPGLGIIDYLEQVSADQHARCRADLARVTDERDEARGISVSVMKGNARNLERLEAVSAQAAAMRSALQLEWEEPTEDNGNPILMCRNCRESISQFASSYLIHTSDCKLSTTAGRDLLAELKELREERGVCTVCREKDADHAVTGNTPVSIVSELAALRKIRDAAEAIPPVMDLMTSLCEPCTAWNQMSALRAALEATKPYENGGDARLYVIPGDGGVKP